jgi:2-octaprenyl-3-methyl-6-methoxy-1,4-benzoquinol hydroxylase
VNTHEHDITVIGAGLVGACVANLLARSGYSVGVVEQAAAPEFDPASDCGLQVSALSPGSQAILQQAGAWAGVVAARHCPYRRMQVEDRDGGVQMEFDAPSHGLERLGTIVENDLLRSVLWSGLQSSPLVSLYCPARLAAIEHGGEGATARLEDGTVLRSALLLGADGPTSRVRSLVGVKQDVWEYNQQGLVCAVRKSEANRGVAWQRFLAGGPLAFLPLADGRSSIVWTLPAERAAQLLQADAAAFAAELERASQGWLGRVEACGPRAVFPLQMRLSERNVSGRVVLLGDAAQVVHPLAGQGVNLGFADTAALLETLLAARLAGAALGAPQPLAAFQRWRRSEARLMAGAIHTLGGLFAGDGLAPLRRLGMQFAGHNWLAADAFVRRAAGLSGQAPRLSRGEGLAALLRPASGVPGPHA